jgi:hypothetical protein
MPPKGKKGGAGADKLKEVNETEEALQAVVSTTSDVS